MNKTTEAEILKYYSLHGLQLINELKQMLPLGLEENSVAIGIITLLTSDLRLCLLEYEKFITVGKRNEADTFTLWASDKILSETTRLGRRLTSEEILKIRTEDSNRPFTCAKCGWKDVAFNCKRIDDVIVCLECEKNA